MLILNTVNQYITLTKQRLDSLAFARRRHHQPQNLYVRGDKRYELTNHLGNVLATVSDKHLSQGEDNGPRA
jgi:hypothetical protein